MNEKVVTSLLLLVMIGAFGFFMYQIGQHQASREEKQLVLKPYTGLGSGVLAPGTVLRENYKEPASILGRVEGGVWIIEEVQDGNR